jgi:hypothetical protein
MSEHDSGLGAGSGQTGPSVLPRSMPPSGAGGRGDRPLAFSAVRGGLAVAASAYSNIVIGFLANLVLTRMLAADAFGALSLATFFFSLFNLRP